jgi:predicted RNA binding protein YcfA (HicA-like mRNA interferase family)
MSPRLPALRPREAIRALERAGFFVARTSGSHHFMKHPDHPERSVTIAYHATDLKPGTLRAIIKQAGLTVERFLELL